MTTFWSDSGLKEHNTITAVFGRKGCGKTTLVKSLIEKSIKPHIVIIDFIGEYSGWIVKDYKGFVADYPKEKILAVRILSLAEIERVLLLCSRLSNLLVVCSEVDAYSRPSYIPVGLQSICRYGRHRRIDLMFDSRRPAEVPRLLTSQSDVLYSFRILEKRDIEYLTDFSGKDCSRLRHLEEFEYLRLR